jgi:hypothetical protein
MKILAIDPATKSGWAHSDGDSGVWDFAIKADESSGMRLLRFRSKIREIYTGLGFGLIVYESPSVASGAKANMNGFKLISKLQGVIETFVETKGGLESKGYNLQSIKKHAGCRKKDEMVKAAREKWADVEIEDDNQADALWLLDLAQTDLNL